MSSSIRGLMSFFTLFILALTVSAVAATSTSPAYRACTYISKVDASQDVLEQALSAFRDAFRLSGIPQDIFIYANTFYVCPCGEWGIGGGGTGDSAIGGGTGDSAIGGGTGDSAIGGGTGDSAIGGGTGDSAIGGGTGDSAIGGGTGDSAIGGGTGDSAIGGGTGDSAIGGGTGDSAIGGGTGDSASAGHWRSAIGGGFAQLQCRSVNSDSRQEIRLRIPIGSSNGVKLFDGVTFYPVTVETYGTRTN